MKISEAEKPKFGWAITCCDCRDTRFYVKDKYHELESRDGGNTWFCPNCERTTKEIFAHKTEHFDWG